jgi:lipoate-protein ligase A
VAKVTVRLLPYAVADGPHNMAADETLLESAVTGRASLRFYGWSTATLSLGYFQREAVRRQVSRLAVLPCVRRPSGGATLVHHHELTYCLALPAELARRGASPWLRRMHGIIVTVLLGFGIPCRWHEGGKHTQGPVLCFLDRTSSDVVLGEAKIVGSAQRRRRGALLQHGATLLGQSPHTPELPGIRELTGVEIEPKSFIGAVKAAFTNHTGWNLCEEEWVEGEHRKIEELVVKRYANPVWTTSR